MSRGGRRFSQVDRVTEDVEQASFFDWLRVTRWQGRSLSTWYFHVPNGGSRHLLEAVKLKRMGVKAGVFDVCGLIAIPPYHGHLVEMKAVGGRLSDAQREFHELATEAGYRADVCFGWHEAARAVERYLGKAGTVVERVG
jgi:hypothetical protein